MKHFSRLRYFTGALAVLMALVACNPNDEPNTDNNFDRKAMLSNYADHLITPAYAHCNEATNDLVAAIAAFNNTPAASGFEAIQTAWVRAYSSYQYINAYNFGPAGEAGLRKALVEEIGTFPASTAKIDNAITAGTWNFEDSNRDARGFLAIEYLIFDKNGNTPALIAELSNNPVRRAYLLGVAQNVQTRLNTITAEWVNYRTTFVNNDGTDAGSSTSLLYNEFVRSYESIKNFKLGLPLGKSPGQTQSEPQLLEALYSAQSLSMLQTHYAAIEDIWYGRDKNGNAGIGLRAYLENVEGGTTLILSTEAQMTAVRTALAAVPTNISLYDQISNGNPNVATLYVELQKLVRFFKSDLSSLLGIAITFNSSDGD